MEELCAFFKALAEETRFRIFSFLLSREMCVCEIVDGLKLPQPLVSHHLHHLREAGLVKVRREGIWMYYTIDQDRLNGYKRKFLQELQRASAVQVACKFACCEKEVVASAKRTR